MASTRITDNLAISYQGQDRSYTAAELVAVFDGGAGGGRAGARTTMTLSYVTQSQDPTVYYTSLDPDGNIITLRTTTGVELSPCGDWTYVETVTGLDQFVAVWDEGDENDFVIERIMVDT